MRNAFDQFDAAAETANPFDAFDEETSSGAEGVRQPTPTMTPGPAGMAPLSLEKRQQNLSSLAMEQREIPAVDLQTRRNTGRSEAAQKALQSVSQRKNQIIDAPMKYDGFAEATGKSLSNLPERFQQSFGGLAQMLGEDMDRERERTARITSAKLGIRPDEYKLLAWAGKEGLVDLKTPVLEALESLKSQMVTSLDDDQLREVADVGLINPETIASAGRDLRRDARSTMAPVNAEPGSAAYYGSAAIASVAEMAPALLASALTRNPAVGMGIIGGQVGGESYGEARDEGLSPEESQRYAMAQTAAEAIPEALPISVILKPGANFFMKLAKAGAAEGLQETVTAALQAGIDKGTITPDMTWEQARSRIADGAIIGAIAGPGMAAAVEPIVRYQNRGASQAAAPQAEEAAPPILQPEVDPQPVDAEAASAEVQPRADVAREEIQLHENPFDAFDDANIPVVGPQEFEPQASAPAAVPAVEPVAEAVPEAKILASPEPDLVGTEAAPAKPKRSALPETVSAGPATLQTKPINKPVYRETNAEGLDDLMLKNNGGSLSEAYVADNPDLALGQKDNTGIKVRFSSGAVSGTPNQKPGTSAETGLEYKLDYQGADSIDQVIVSPEAKLTKRSKMFLRRQFDKTALPDGRVVYTRQGETFDPADMDRVTDLTANLEQAAQQVDLAPTEAQKEAGNYRKGHIKLQGLDIAIENPKDSTRSGTAPDGKKWESKMAHHYGYINRSEGADGDQVDVFIGDDTASDRVFIIDQVNADGSFDEHKVMMGFRTQKAARDGYRANYEAGWKVGPTTRMSMEEFKAWLKSGDTKKPVSGGLATAQPQEKGEPAQAAKRDPEALAQPEPAKAGWKQSAGRKRVWEHSDGRILTDESMTVGGKRTRLFMVYQNRNAWDQGNNYTSASSLAEAKRKGETEVPGSAPVREAAAEIEDFGEKLGGSRKDRAKMASLSRELSSDEIASLPLSKIWPKSEVDAIEDHAVAAFATAARAEIPAKPRKQYLLDRWVEKVRAIRSLADLYMEDPARLSEIARDPKWSRLGNFFAKVELLGQVARTHWSRIGEVAPYPNAYRFDRDSGEKVPSPQVSVKIDGRTENIRGAKTVTEAIDAIREKLGAQAAPVPAMKFMARGRGNNFYIHKDGDPLYRKLKEFTSSQEALAYIRENNSELVKAWEEVKERDNVRKTDVRDRVNKPRTGKDHREGKNVEPEQFTDMFGFRGVEFGNWLKQGAGSKDRQGMLNEVYDALMDLSDIVGVPPKALSLNGTLGLGLGSRGSGNASAHFEPDSLVINMTKTKGAGSLAHEWFHALDNYFSRMRGGEVKVAGGANAAEAYRAANFVTYRPEPMLVHKTKPSRPITRADLERNFARTSAPYLDPKNWQLDPNHPEGVRPEVEARFAELVNVLNESPMKGRALNIDKGKENGYWSQIIERAARSFENYVIAKMQKNGYDNDFLANVVSINRFARNPGNYPYLLESEMQPVEAAFDNLFSTVQARETDEGVALFSRDGEFRRAPGAQAQAMTAAEARAVSAKLMKNWAGAPSVTIADEITEFPAGLRAAVRLAGAEGDMRAVFWQDQVYVLASRIPDRAALEEVILHEVIGHYGLRKMLGDDLKPVLNQVWGAAGGRKRAQGIIESYFPDGDFDVNNREHRDIVAEELIAEIAETKRHQKLWARIVTTIRTGLRRLGFRLPLNGSDILGLLQGAQRAVERGGIDRSSDSGAVEPPAAVASYARDSTNASENAPSRSGADAPAVETDQVREGVAATALAPGSESVDVEVESPRFSRAAAAGDIPVLDTQPFGPPSDTVVRRAVSKLADKFTVLKGIQNKIREQGGQITEGQDAYQAEELFHGKVENDIRLLRENMIEPLAEKMSEYGISLSELDRFLYALHAPERNKVIAERNAQLKSGGSGMTDSEAAEIIQEVDGSGKLAQYKELAGRVHAMLEKRRSILRQAGLLDEETLGAWEVSYRFYVPLKGWAADELQESGGPRTGKGFAIAGKESQMAGGRSSKASSPTANAIADLSEAVVRHRKNEVGNAFLNLVAAHPNPDYWAIYSDENPEVDRKPVRVKDPETGRMKIEVREQTVPMAMMSDRYFTTKRNGKTYYIKLQDERLMKAMRNMGPENNSAVVRVLGSVTRLMSALNTSYNPEFVISNFSRDIQTAILNLKSEQSADDGKARGKEIAGKTVRDVGTSIRVINASLKGKALTGKGAAWQKYFDQFRADGAQTGWFDMKDIAGQMEDLETMIGMAGGGATNRLRRAFKASADWVENTNKAIENGVRLSAYVNAIEAGIPRARAASLAKNMTVNFNRRGELGTTMNALYMFANASVQGSANFVRTLGRLNGQQGDRMWSRLNAAQKIAVGMAVGGFFLSLLNRLVAGEDEDGVNWWEKVPDYVKERNIVIMKSLVGGESGAYWTIPLPYGYNVFPVLGNSMEQMLNSDKPAGRIAGNVVLASLGSFSPLGFEESQEAYGTVIKNIMPTILRPVASISLNENFMGGPIYKENYPFGVQKPDSSLSFRSTSNLYKDLAKSLNSATGGSDFRSGAMDISPDVMDYLVGYFGGGAYDFFTSRVPNFMRKASSGVELEDREVPFLRKVSGKVLPYEDQSKFYDRRNEIQQLAAEKDNLGGRARSEFLREYREILRLEPMIKSSEKRLKSLRARRDRIEAMAISDADKDERLQDVERQIKMVIDRFNQRYNALED